MSSTTTEGYKRTRKKEKEGGRERKLPICKAQTTLIMKMVSMFSVTQRTDPTTQSLVWVSAGCKQMVRKQEGIQKIKEAVDEKLRPRNCSWQQLRARRIQQDLV